MLSSGCNNTFLYSSYILVRGGLASNLNSLPLQALKLVMGSQIIIHFICISGHEDYLRGNYQLRQFKPSNLETIYNFYSLFEQDVGRLLEDNYRTLYQVVPMITSRRVIVFFKSFQMLSSYHRHKT